MAELKVCDPNAVYGAVTRLIATNKKFVVACTGAAAGLQDRLWQTSGLSKSLLDSHFPYAPEAFDLYIGKDWKVATGLGNCNILGAIALAQSSYFRAQQLRALAYDRTSDVIGLGLSAAAETARILRGGTRCSAAVRDRHGLHAVEVCLEQRALGRTGDGQVCDMIGLNLLLFAAGIRQIPFSDDLHLTSDNLAWEKGVKDKTKILFPWPHAPAVSGFPDCVEDGVVLGINGRHTPLSEYEFSNAAVYAGSYNPLHFAHVEAAKMVELATGRKVVFEITSNNADKSAQSAEELIRRAGQFIGMWPVILHNGDGRFSQKTEQYSGAHFVAGTDTALRILDPRFEGSHMKLLKYLRKLLARRTRIYTFERVVNGKFLHFQDLPIPAGFEELFVPLPGRWDISSTQCREPAAIT